LVVSSQTPTKLVHSIAAIGDVNMDKLASIASRLTLPITDYLAEHTQLLLSEQHLAIHAPTLGKPIYVDFAAGKNAHRRQFGGGRGQPFAKAIGLKHGATPTVIDATGGFARDAFVLASLGCQVTLLERNPILSLLIEDALQRAEASDDIAEICAAMQIINTDAVHYLHSLTPKQFPDVVYMDPMYPSRDKSALVKKDMQLLHQLVGADNDSATLLVAAKAIAKKRVVVKRPKGADFVGQQKPATSIESKNTRYDIYL